MTVTGNFWATVAGYWAVLHQELKCVTVLRGASVSSKEYILLVTAITQHLLFNAYGPNTFINPQQLHLKVSNILRLVAKAFLYTRKWEVLVSG